MEVYQYHIASNTAPQAHGTLPLPFLKKIAPPPFSSTSSGTASQMLCTAGSHDHRGSSTISKSPFFLGDHGPPQTPVKIRIFLGKILGGVHGPPPVPLAETLKKNPFRAFSPALAGHLPSYIRKDTNPHKSKLIRGAPLIKKFLYCEKTSKKPGVRVWI